MGEAAGPLPCTSAAHAGKAIPAAIKNTEKRCIFMSLHAKAQTALPTIGRERAGRFQGAVLSVPQLR